MIRAAGTLSLLPTVACVQEPCFLPGHLISECCLSNASITLWARMMLDLPQFAHLNGIRLPLCITKKRDLQFPRIQALAFGAITRIEKVCAWLASNVYGNQHKAHTS